MSRANLNPNNPAVKRIMREMKEHLRSKSDEFKAGPVDDDNIFEWHFTITGPAGTDFEGGRYHGRIVLPPQYPFKPPDILLLTPNGRFALKKKICLNVSNYHPEEWQPSWDIRTVLTAMRSFLATPGAGAIGAVDCPPAERKKLARRSVNWRCADCDISMRDVFAHLKIDEPAKVPPPTPSASSDELSKPSASGEPPRPSATSGDDESSMPSAGGPSDEAAPSNSSADSSKDSNSPSSSLDKGSPSVAHSADSSSSPKPPASSTNKRQSSSVEKKEGDPAASQNKPRERRPNAATGDADVAAAAAAAPNNGRNVAAAVPRRQRPQAHQAAARGVLGTQDDMLSAITLALVFMIVGILARKMWFSEEF